jgi:hypothetical protein
MFLSIIWQPASMSRIGKKVKFVWRFGIIRYEHVRVTENRLEPTQNGRGLFSYLFDNVSNNYGVTIPTTWQLMKCLFASSKVTWSFQLSCRHLLAWKLLILLCRGVMALTFSSFRFPTSRPPDGENIRTHKLQGDYLQGTPKLACALTGSDACSRSV